MNMRYIVTRQYLRGTESPFANFLELNDAKLFVQEKLAVDVAMKVNVIYRINEFGEAIETFDSSKPGVVTESQSSQGSQGSQGQGQQSTSRPTPLSTVPRPPGMPQSWDRGKPDSDGGEGKK